MRIDVEKIRHNLGDRPSASLTNEEITALLHCYELHNKPSGYMYSAQARSDFSGNTH